MSVIIGAAVTIALATIACYASLCTTHPFRSCRRCHGSGLDRQEGRDAQACGACESLGLRVRLGRLAWYRLTGAADITGYRADCHWRCRP